MLQNVRFLSILKAKSPNNSPFARIKPIGRVRQKYKRGKPVARRRAPIMPERVHSLPLHLKLTSPSKLPAIDAPIPIKESKNVPMLPSRAELMQIDSFRRLGLHPLVVKNIHHVLKFNQPTEMQKLAIPAILSKDKVLVAGESANGKTAAYLAPIIHKLLNQDLAILNEFDQLNPDAESKDRLQSLSKIRLLKRPRTVILVPTRDLVKQVYHSTRLLTTDTHLRVAGLTRPMSRRSIRKKLEVPIDILITTPATLEWMMTPSKIPKAVIAQKLMSKVEEPMDELDHVCKIMEKEWKSVRKITEKALEKPKYFKLDDKKLIRVKGLDLVLSRCEHFVLDEADTLFDRHNYSTIHRIIDPIMKRHDKHLELVNNGQAAEVNGVKVRPCQLVLSSSILPKTLTAYLKKQYPTLCHAVTNRLHRPILGLNQEFLRLDSSTGRHHMLLQVLKRSFAAGNKRLLIFCNYSDSAKDLSKRLMEMNMNVFPYIAGTMKRHLQQRRLTAFMAPVQYPEIKIPTDIADPSTLFEQGLLKIESNESPPTINSTQKEEEEEKDHRPLLFDEIPFNEDPTQPMIMISTDYASRGLDFKHLDHVIQYEFPVSMIDYLHRAGRTARGKKNGLVTSIVTRRSIALADYINRMTKSGNDFAAE